MPIIKPAPTQKYNTKRVQIHKKKTPNRQNKNNAAEKKQYKRRIGTKNLNPEKHR
jgi:hypothetical protein